MLLLVAPVVGLTTCGVLACAPRSLVRFMLGLYVGATLICLAGLIGYLGHALVSTLLHDHPTVVFGAGIAAAAATLLGTAVRLRPEPTVEPAPRQPRDEGPGDDGGEPPAPPQPPSSPSGDGLRVDWDGFDTARQGWERQPVPA